MARILVCLNFLAVFASAQNWTWRGTASLNEARSEACIVRLADGRVLVSGGSSSAPLASAEIYQSSPSESFTPAAPMNAARSSHGCALLKDGRVLAAGGGTAGIELYEPSIDTWTTVDSTILRKSGTSVIALADGRALITGGKAIEIEVFDPDTSALTLLPAVLTLRDRASTTLLRDGRILLAGGIGDQGALNSAEIFDPETVEVKAVPALASPRAGHSATLLLDGRVLLAGGSNGQSELNTLEVWLPDSNRFELLQATLKDARQNHTALLSDSNGIVLAAGGSAAGTPLATSELFDPSIDAVLDAGSLTAARSAIAGVVLEDGSILATGGRGVQGPSAACGILPSPSFRFSQTVYHPLEHAVISGTIGIPNISVRISFDLVRIDSTGKSTNVNSRLVNSSGNLSNGTLPPTTVVDLFRDDIGSDFVLTMKATISSSQTVSVQVRFPVKLRTTLQITALTGATIAGQPVPTRATLLADGASVAFSGTLNISAGGVSLSQSISRQSISVIMDNPLCCPLAGGTSSVPGVLSLNATYGGNAFLEPSSATNTHLLVSRVPQIVPGVPALRLASPTTIIATAIPVGPPIPTNQSVTIDSSLRPTGNVTLNRNGTAFSTAALQPPSTFVVTAVPTYPSSQTSFSYTPSILDRRAGSVCFDFSYSGDSRYLGSAPINTGGLSPTIGDGSVRVVSNCSQVTAALSALQALAPPTTYTLGVTTAFSVRLTWPNSVGIVGRNVNVIADGRSAGAINLTPDPTGLGIADGASNIVLPFNAKNLMLAYDQSGDLLSSQAVIPISMSPVPTTVTSTLAATVTNPFSIPYTIRLTNRGVAIPPNTSLGGSIEFRDGDTVIGTVPAPVLQSGTGITDGTSNTILVGEVTISGVLTNVIRPVGQRNITIRYTGSTLFQTAQLQLSPIVQ